MHLQASRKEDTTPFMSGGAGTVLSRGAVSLMPFDLCTEYFLQRKPCMQSDWMLGRCAHASGVFSLPLLQCGLGSVTCHPDRTLDDASLVTEMERISSKLQQGGCAFVQQTHRNWVDGQGHGCIRGDNLSTALHNASLQLCDAVSRHASISHGVQFLDQQSHSWAVCPSGARPLAPSATSHEPPLEREAAREERTVVPSKVLQPAAGLSLRQPVTASCPAVECPFLLYHFVPYGYNFGDAAGRKIFDFAAALSGLGPCSATRDASLRPIVIGLGSVLHHVAEPAHGGRPLHPPKSHAVVWGAGSIGFSEHALPKNQDSFAAHGGRFDIRAVRGPLTLSLLRATGMLQAEDQAARNAADVALGDPGLIMPLIYPRCRRQCARSQKSPGTHRRLCVISHKNDARYYRAIADGTAPQAVRDAELGGLPLPSFRYAHLTAFEPMLEYILQCPLVVSSSLHGVIFAEAFGVPARWLSPQHPTNGSRRSEQ